MNSGILGKVLKPGEQGTWMRRFFVLDNNILGYHEGEEETASDFRNKTLVNHALKITLEDSSSWILEIS
jgi:hypothetical protein